MIGICSILLLFVVHLGASTCHHKQFKPHIIFVVADDLGWNDVGFHNPAMWTPNIDCAAHNGIILNYSYVQDICTPSRSTFMTGYFPYRTGMQYFVIPFFAPYGLPLQFKLLPQVLKDLGYSTNMIGKWHLGSCNPKYFPTNRGFDTFFGFLGGAEHYYTHSYPLTEDNVAMSKPGLMEVYDLWNQTTASLEYNNTYSAIPFMTQLQTILANRKPNVPLYLYLPFQEAHAPIEVDKDNFFWYSEEQNPYRKGFSALTTQLDYNFGQLIKMLKDNGVYDESIIIFTSDNGGEILSGANNYPLRGGKVTLYEGGTRASAFIHSPLLKKKGFTYNGLLHSVDWYPTIVALAGGTPDPQMDGVNVWEAIVNNETSPRTGFVYNIADNGDGKLQGAIRHGKWKLIFGDAGLPNTQVKPGNVTGQLYSACGGMALPDANGPPFQLYNIDDDPTESNDLVNSEPSVVAELKWKVHNYSQKMVKAVFLPNDATLYRNLTQDLRILNTNWCTAIDNVTLMNSV